MTRLKVNPGRAKEGQLAPCFARARLGDLTSRQVGEGSRYDSQSNKSRLLRKVENSAMQCIIVCLVLDVSSVKRASALPSPSCWKGLN
jgi:hypothetical protein